MSDFSHSQSILVKKLKNDYANWIIEACVMVGSINVISRLSRDNLSRSKNENDKEKDSKFTTESENQSTQNNAQSEFSTTPILLALQEIHDEPQQNAQDLQEKLQFLFTLLETYRDNVLINNHDTDDLENCLSAIKELKKSISNSDLLIIINALEVLVSVELAKISLNTNATE